MKQITYNLIAESHPKAKSHKNFGLEIPSRDLNADMVLLSKEIDEVAEKSPQQQLKVTKTMSAVITS